MMSLERESCWWDKNCTASEFDMTPRSRSHDARPIEMQITTANYDRRWSPRLQCDLRVKLLCDGVEPLHGRCCNLGLEGMYAELEVECSPPCCDSRVDALFEYPDASGQRVVHRITSRLAHVAARGIGIEFLQFDPTLFEAIHLRIERPVRRVRV